MRELVPLQMQSYGDPRLTPRARRPLLRPACDVGLIAGFGKSFLRFSIVHETP